MEFRIADTFTDRLAKLTGDEQKAAKTTAFDLQMDPSGAGHSFHKLDRAKDRNFWSIRVSRDIRLIVHRTASSVLLAYVGRHDAAYRWGERRRIERHPRTGAAQIVEIRETVREIEVPRPIVVEAPAAERPAPKPALFAPGEDGRAVGGYRADRTEFLAALEVERQKGGKAMRRQTVSEVFVVVPAVDRHSCC